MNNPPIRYGQCDDTCTVDCGHCKGEGPPAVPSARVDLDRRQDRSTSERSDHEHEMVMPFVICESQGGPHNDDAFVSGWRLGQIDQHSVCRHD